jgi:hypothetical protein
MPLHTVYMEYSECLPTRLNSWLRGPVLFLPGSDIFLPWFSECAWSAFGASDPATLQRFSQLANKCAATDARQARAESLAAGADPADDCSQILDCGSCGAVPSSPTGSVHLYAGAMHLKDGFDRWWVHIITPAQLA